MNYLLIFLTFIAIGISLEFFRLILAKILNFEVKEFSIFFGPELIKFNISNTKYSIKSIPFGAYIELDESNKRKDNIYIIIFLYLPRVIFFIISYFALPYVRNYVLHTAILLSVFVAGAEFIFSILFRTNKHFFDN